MQEDLLDLQCTIDAILIPDLLHLLKTYLPERVFQVASVDFYHDLPSEGELAASQSISNDTRRQCGDSCLLDLHEFVLQEASIGLKKNIPNFGYMLSGRLPLKSMRNYGFAPVYNTIAKFKLSQLFNESIGHQVRGGDGDQYDGKPEELEYRIEAGGGSGMGFQLLCDGNMVLTAGSGGGGRPDRNVYD